MTLIAFIGFVILVMGPMVLAFLYGGRLLDRIDRSRSATRRKRRYQVTTALPIRSESVKALLAAEAARNTLDEQVTRTLIAFGALSTGGPVPVEVSEGHLLDVEQGILFRESRFGAYLDLAQVQNDIIYVLDEEVALLRKLAEVKADPRQAGPGAERPAPKRPTAVKPADKLKASLEAAVSRRREADAGIGALHLRKGGSIDFTVGDEHAEDNAGRNPE